MEAPDLNTWQLSVIHLGPHDVKVIKVVKVVNVFQSMLEL